MLTAITLPPASAVRALLEEFPDVRGPVRLDAGRRDRLLQAMYDRGFVPPFDWGAWVSAHGRALMTDPVALSTMDAAAAVGLITGLVRSDRFVSGELDAALGDGRLGAILARIEELLPSWPEVP